MDTIFLIIVFVSALVVFGVDTVHKRREFLAEK